MQDLRSSIGGLRLLNVLFAAAAAWIALGVIGQRVRSRLVAAWIGLAVVTQPLFLMNAGSSVERLVGRLLATTVIIAQSMVRDDRRITWRFAAMGVVTGFAILIKGTNWSLVPIITLALAFTTIRNRTPIHRALIGGHCHDAVCRGIVGPEVRFNLATYGVPTSCRRPSSIISKAGACAIGAADSHSYCRGLDWPAGSGSRAV